MKRVRIVSSTLLVLALAAITGSAIESSYIPDFFEDCEDYEVNPFDDESYIVPVTGYYIETSCGTSVVGYRMFQLSQDEVPLFCCYYTGNIYDRCYVDYVTHIYPYFPYE